MPTFTEPRCPHCRAINATGSPWTYCPCCGHHTDLPRADCDCAHCARLRTTIELRRLPLLVAAKEMAAALKELLPGHREPLSARAIAALVMLEAALEVEQERQALLNALNGED